MISERELNLVSAGLPPPIEMFGNFFSVVTSVVGYFTAAPSVGHYTARDDMGQSGTVTQVSANFSPIGCGKLLDVRKDHVTVLNSDNMRDLQGTQVSIGATASLPPIIQRGLSDKYGRSVADHCAFLSGNGVGAEFSLPVKSDTGRHDVLCKITKITDQQIQIRGTGIGQFGIDLYGSTTASFVDVKNVDQTACLAYAESKKHT